MDKIYDRAWKLIASPDRWTKGAIGRDVYGERCGADSAYSVRWCAIGALLKVYGYALTKEALRKLESTIDGVAKWNDAAERKHVEVVELLKERDL